MSNPYSRIARFKTAAAFRAYIDALGIKLPFDEVIQSGPDSPLAQPYILQDGRVIGNRFCIQPMEGWDGTADGLPTGKTRRRWRNFGISDAKLICGCEAVAVRHDGRANPNQLILGEANKKGLAGLRQSLLQS